MSPFVAGNSSFAIKAQQLKAPKLADRRRYIHFYGEAFNNAAFNYSFDVLSGDQPPTVTDGYGQWTQMQRPLRTGLMVYTGRSPIVMQVSVRFSLFDGQGSWLTDRTAGIQIEEQIRLLEWMAGSGVSGTPPIVFLSTYDQSGNTTSLIPFNYQAGTPNVPALFNDLRYAPRWVITGLTWDPAPIRTVDALRVRQDCTVTATMYESPSGSASRGQPRPKGVTVVSRAGTDTALTITRTVPAEDPYKTALAIIGAPQNKKLRLRSVNQVIKHGKRVYVPSSANG